MLLIKGESRPLTVALGRATTARNASYVMTASASFSWSTAVLTVFASRPLGSVYVVSFMPSLLAASFIFRTKAASESLSVAQRASSRAMLLPEGIISIFSMSRWLNLWPTVSPSTRDSCLALPSATALASTSIMGPPVSSFFGGRSVRRT